MRETVSTFCALCVSRCGAQATIEDGRFVALRADPSHPTGQALCIKGKVSPEIVYHPERLTQPLVRTRPKGDGDPGWKAIGWDEALDTVASRLRELSNRHGAECVAFASASPSTTAMSDSVDYLDRLRRAFGTPNLFASLELCGWGRYYASAYTFGAPMPGLYMPDLEHAGCILFWGYNPSVSRITHAAATAEARRRGARLVVVDPRRVGMASRADVWLQVRPGTDAALALSIAHVMIDGGLYDEAFVRRWTNGPHLVRSDDGRLLRERDLDGAREGDRLVAWQRDRGPVLCDAGAYPCPEDELELLADVTVETRRGPVRCRPAFALVAESCRRYDPRVAAEITGVPAEAIERAARVLWESRPVALYFWSGIEQHTGTSQIARAICQLYALTGSFDRKGGNTRFPAVPQNGFLDGVTLPPEQAAKALGLGERPLGPSRWQFVTSGELYTAALEGTPYRLRGLVGFGANLLLASADSRRGRDALAALEFFVHADLFMNPTAEQADVVLPVASCFEAEALRVGFEVSPEAQSLVQLRRPVAPRPGQARSDLEIIFALAKRLGLGDQFWGGDVDAAYRHRLAPSGISLEALRRDPAGVRVDLSSEYERHTTRGFGTPSRKVELYSETLLAHGQPPLPAFEEPAMSPRRSPDLAARYPLVLTCTKSTHFCETQHRQLSSLRRRAPDPEVDLHPDTASARGIHAGDWVRVETPHGSVRARANLDDTLAPDVVCGQHGWWQACEELGAPGYDPFDESGANLNLVLRHDPSDPMSGTPPLRSYVCEVSRDGSDGSPPV